jgi:hypothetical protein
VWVPGMLGNCHWRKFLLCCSWWWWCSQLSDSEVPALLWASHAPLHTVFTTWGSASPCSFRTTWRAQGKLRLLSPPPPRLWFSRSGVVFQNLLSSQVPKDADAGDGDLTLRATAQEMSALLCTPFYKWGRSWHWGAESCQVPPSREAVISIQVRPAGLRNGKLGFGPSFSTSPSPHTLLGKLNCGGPRAPGEVECDCWSIGSKAPRLPEPLSLDFDADASSLVSLWKEEKTDEPPRRYAARTGLGIWIFLPHQHPGGHFVLFLLCASSLIISRRQKPCTFPRIHSWAVF